MTAIFAAAALAAGRGPVVWAPQPGSQTMFLSCPIAEAAIEGTRGSAKTDALLMDFARDVGKGYGAAWRGILFRRTYKQLDDVVARSKRWFYQIFPRAQWLASKDAYKWVWPDGEELLFRHMDNPEDYWNYHGHEYPWQGWEELTNWPSLECYETMAACWRSSVVGVPKRRRSTFNPFGSGHHVVKAYWIDPAPPGVIIRDAIGNERVRLHAHWSENRKLLEADPDYPKRLAADTNPNRRRAWLLGDWDIVAGGFFDDLWDRNVHVVKPFAIPSSWRINRSFDWGSSKPFSVGWWAESDGTEVVCGDGRVLRTVRGDLFRIAEWYGWTGQPNEGSKLSAKKVAKGIVDREKRWKNELGWNVRPGPADSSIFDTENEKCIADDMKGEGVTWTHADKRPGSRKNGWERMRIMLDQSLPQIGPDGWPIPREAPGLFIFDSCTQFIRTVPVLPRDAQKTDDIDTDTEDHIADESRYRVSERSLEIGQIEAQY